MHSLNISEQCEEQEAELAEVANDLRNSVYVQLLFTLSIFEYNTAQ